MSDPEFLFNVFVRVMCSIAPFVIAVIVLTAVMDQVPVGKWRAGVVGVTFLVVTGFLVASVITVEVWIWREDYDQPTWFTEHLPLHNEPEGVQIREHVRSD